MTGQMSALRETDLARDRRLRFLDQAPAFDGNRQQEPHPRNRAARPGGRRPKLRVLISTRI